MLILCCGKEGDPVRTPSLAQRRCPGVGRERFDPNSIEGDLTVLDGTVWQAYRVPCVWRFKDNFVSWGRDIRVVKVVGEESEEAYVVHGRLSMRKRMAPGISPASFRPVVTSA